ncbi:MAG TPA: SRPBCC domain-containing protein [Mucilaginibacter sp.]|nr:SRPBCC domain-containing protein [Mucilaginibacter sp.]
MDTTPLIIERTLNAPVTKVWKALTNLEQLAQWFSKLDDFKPEPGFEFTIYDHYISSCQVIEAIENKKLSYSLSFNEFPAHTIVTFELFDEGDKTGIKLTHSGIQKIHTALNTDFGKEQFNQGWNGLLTALQRFLENA